MQTVMRVNDRDLAEASRELRDLVARVTDWRPVLRLVGVQLQGSVLRNFEMGGRPPWPASIRVRKHGGQTLIGRTGVLRRSLQNRPPVITGPRTVEIGTNVRYAAVHQFGFSGMVQIPEHLRRVRSRDIHGKERRVSKKTGKSYTARPIIGSGFAVVRAHPAHLRIPARPYLMVQAEDWPIIEDLLAKHIEGK